MDQTYRDTITKMEQKGVDPEYVLGWQGGYSRPPRDVKSNASLMPILPATKMDKKKPLIILVIGLSHNRKSLFTRI